MNKSRISGIDDFIQSTEKPQEHAKLATQEKLTLINFQLPVSLKKRLSKYCIDNEITIREFLTGLIEKHIME
jgi:hypothetical protein